MGFMADSLERRMDTGVTSTLQQPDRAIFESLGIRQSTAGVPVTELRAESLAAVYGSVNVIADIVSWLPLKIVKDAEGGGREDAKLHAAYYLLHDQFNHLMTAIDGKNVMERWKNLWGTAYAEIEWSTRGEPIALWPLRTDRMEKPKTDALGRLVWKYRLADGSTKDYVWNPARPPFLRLMINSLDGITGRSPVRVLMDAIGPAIASRDFGGYLFANKTNIGGVLAFKGPKPDPETQKQNRENWEKVHKGVHNAGRTAVLYGDAEYTSIGIPPQEAQFIELMAAQRLDIRGYMYRVPGFLVGDTEKSTSWGTGIEQQMRGFLTVTMMPHLTSWTQAIKRDMLSAKAAGTHTAIFVTDALVQADLEARVTAEKTQIEGGTMTPNQARALRDQPPRLLPDGTRDPEGDAYWRPANMTSTAQPAPAPAPVPAEPVASNNGDDDAN